MLDQVVGALVPCPGSGGCFIDGTVGSGGHAAAMLDRAGSGARLLGLDRDPSALQRAARRLRPYGDAVCLMPGCLADMAELAGSVQWPPADGILMDLGVSSDQLSDPARGFSFMHEGPLDMRMDPSRGLTAAELLAGIEAGELETILRNYGEERAARRIACAIVRENQRQPILTTGRLATVVAAVRGVHGLKGRHPATRCFQALRIAVNQELEQLEIGLEKALELLRPGGRLAVVSFHSLEDRIVKTCFRRHAGRSVSLAVGGSRFEFKAPRGRLVTRRPVVPDGEETQRNTRARSAKLRVIQREDEANETKTTCG